MFDRILLWSHLVLGFVFLEIFDHSFNFSACNWVVHNFYFSWLSLGGWPFLSICPFPLGCPFYCRRAAHNGLLSPFTFCIVCVISSFLVLLIWFFSLFFLMSLAEDLSILFIFSKNQLLVLLIFRAGLWRRLSAKELMLFLFLEVGLYCYKLPP